MTHILSIDQGTTNSKAVLVADDGTVSAVGGAPVQLSLPAPGWVEQDAEDLWDSVLRAIADCLAQVDGPVDIDGVTVSSQRESVLAWRRSDGTQFGPVIGWQDRRAEEWCRKITTPQAEDVVRRGTGLRIDPMFSAPKINWLLAQTDGSVDDLCVGTVDAWLIWRLTGGAEHVTEAGNASRTLLFDVPRLAWSDELLDLFGVPRRVLPEVRPSNAGFGKTAGVPGLPDGLPILAVLADSHAALYGQGCTRVGMAKATYGTGSSVMSPTASFQVDGSTVPSTLAWLTDRPTYAVEGNILATGAGLVWMATTLGLEGAAELTTLAAEVPDSAGVAFVPAFSGLGAPHWDRGAEAQISGMTQSTCRAHLARAALDAVAHQVCDVVEEMERAGDFQVAELRADGGASASPLLMQIQADLLGREVSVSDAPEVSAIGAALLGWHTLGHSEVGLATERRRHYPDAPDDQRIAARQLWRHALVRSRLDLGSR